MLSITDCLRWNGREVGRPERPLRIWCSYKEWHRWGHPGMVPVGFMDISALKRSLHYILLGNLGKDVGLEFRLGVVLVASKPWEWMNFPRESVQRGDSQPHLSDSLSESKYQMNPPKEIFFPLICLSKSAFTEIAEQFCWNGLHRVLGYPPGHISPAHQWYQTAQATLDRLVMITRTVANQVLIGNAQVVVLLVIAVCWWETMA